MKSTLLLFTGTLLRILICVKDLLRIGPASQDSEIPEK